MKINPIRLVGGTRTAWHKKQLKKLKTIRSNPEPSKKYVFFVRFENQEGYNPVAVAHSMKELLMLIGEWKEKEGFEGSYFRIEKEDIP